MSFNEKIINQTYCILVKEFSNKQDFIFEYTEDNNDLLGRLVYLFVLLFGENSTDENYVVAFMRIVEDIFPTLDVSREEFMDTIDHFKSVIEQSENERSGDGSNTSVMDNGKRGYIYVLINLSMNMLVKIGYTTRDPKIRVSELSKHSGVPTPFILVYKAFFDDCISAEEAIHAKLEEQGYRVSKNREFFELPVYEAIEMIQDFKAGIGG